MSIIKNSPAYLAWLAGSNAQKGNLATNRTAAIRALVLQYGGLPPGFTDAFGDLRPEDMDAATHNQFSTTQQIEKAYQDGVNSMRRQLAARGGLQSGELGYGQGVQDYSHGLNTYNAGNSFLAALNQAISGYTGGVADINAGEAGVISSETGNAATLYPKIAPTSASLVPDSVSKYGFAVYDDGAGGLWKVGPNGPEQFTPPSAAAGGSLAPAAAAAAGGVYAPGPVALPVPPPVTDRTGTYVPVAGGRKYE